MSRWKPQVGEKYYFIALPNVDVSADSWTDGAMDYRLYTMGNCFQTEEEATKMLKAIKWLLASGADEREEVTNLPRKFAPGDYVWYKEDSIPAIVDTVIYEIDELQYIIKYWDAANQQYAFIQEREDQLVKGSFRPFSEDTFNKGLVGKPVTDRKSGSVFLITSFMTSEYRLPASSLCIGDGLYMSRGEASYGEPLVVVHGECMTLTGLYEHYDINGFPCGEFHIEGEEK